MNEQSDSEYHIIRDCIHSHPKVKLMLDHIRNNLEFRIYFTRQMEISNLDTPAFNCITHRMLIGGLIIVWSKAYQDGKQDPTKEDDIILVDANKTLIDSLSGLPGTFDALKAVDWLTEERSDTGEHLLRFPRLGKYI